MYRSSRWYPMNKAAAWSYCCAMLLAACTPATPPVPQTTPTPTPMPRTLGEESSGYGYVPLDGLPVREVDDFLTCFNDSGQRISREKASLLEALPDINVRFAVGELTARGGLNFGPIKVTAQGGEYRAVLDYVNVDAVPVEFAVRKRVALRRGAADDAPPDSTTKTLGLFTVTDSTRLTVLDYEAIAFTSRMTAEQRDSAAARGYDVLAIPVYIGIGMRLTADLRAAKADIALTSLGAIAAEAQAGGLSGTLTVQTLGLAGQSVATILPLPSKLDQTTVENAILALGSSRTALYSGTDANIVRRPRIVGLYSPFRADPQLVNALYAALSQEAPPLARACRAQ